jgi:hypothetical protein
MVILNLCPGTPTQTIPQTIGTKHVQPHRSPDLLRSHDSTHRPTSVGHDSVEIGVASRPTGQRGNAHTEATREHRKTWWRRPEHRHEARGRQRKLDARASVGRAVSIRSRPVSKGNGSREFSCSLRLGAPHEAFPRNPSPRRPGDLPCRR